MSKRFTEDEIRFIEENYAKFGGNYVAENLNREPRSVRAKAKKLGIKVDAATKSNIISKNATERHRKNSYSRVDYKLFSENVNRYSAYLLGLLWADGWTLKRKGKSVGVGIELVADDMEDVIPILEQTGQWTYTKRTRVNRKPTIVAQTTNQHLIDFLSVYDFIEKSYKSPLSLIYHIPESLRYLWWRGYFNGDGCLSGKQKRWKFSFYSTYDYDWDFMKLLSPNYKVLRRITSYGSNSSASIQKNEYMVNSLDYIYSSELSIGFKRKYDKYLELKSYF